MRRLARRRGLLLSSMILVVLCLVGGFPGGVLSYALGTEVDIAHPDGTDWPRPAGGCSASTSASNTSGTS